MPPEGPDDATVDAAIDAANQGSVESRAAVAQGLPAVAPDCVEEMDGDAIDNAVPTYGYQQLPVVGLGGSAGGIQALKTFFAALPPATGTAYVVILHLSPEHESTLPALLQNVTALPVKAVEDGERLQPDHVYVIPPARQLTVTSGHLRLSPLESDRGRRVVVDLFFRSLADAHGPRATAVVLSGADGDGAIGIKRIKERGGLTVVQEPTEAEHDGMPRSSIATGMVDWVLRVADMPARILAYNANEHRLRLPPEDGPQPAKSGQSSQDEAEVSLREVLAFLRMCTGNDFTYYKRATILRRIARRMQVNGVSTLPEYLHNLRTHTGETAALLQDLLISVTNFFRDREAFAAVETRIPDLFAGKGPEDTVRVWCAACATGEEPYSMAMLLTEYARTLPRPPTIQVFGCDLDAESIKTARAGVYPSAIAADVSEERIARFFIKEPRGFQVRRELREIVLFAEHDLLKDAPFSRLDLVSCRNLLIYLEREAQARALEIFHFALKPNGLLFLGSAESVDEDQGLFAPVDKKHRLYVRRPAAHPGLPVPMGAGTLLRTLQALPREFPAAPGPAFARGGARPPIPVPFLSPPEERAALADLHFRLIERYAPPSVIIDAEGEIVHLSENAGRFLRPSGGQPSANLLRTVHPDLRLNLHTALLRAAETQAPVEGFGARVEVEGRARMVDLRVAPASELAPGYVLVSFAAREPDLEAVAEIAVAARPDAEAVVRHLEHELEQTRARLRDTIERSAMTAEEYKSSNEELQSMNEELRSASEELSTSREELQSINEELSTVNLQLKHNVEELGHANSNLHNLMNATSIATVFLDREFKVMRYTPEAVAIFHLIPSDAGRPLADLKRRIDYADLEADTRQVLRTLVPLEREVGDGVNWFLARLSPYRSLGDRIEGVVLTFVDITERNRAQAALHASEGELAVELADTRQLQRISSALVEKGDTDALYAQILEAACAVMRADSATLQILVPERDALWLLAHKGLAPASAKHWEWVRCDDTTSCGLAMKDEERIIIPDVERWDYIAGTEDLAQYRLSGIRAVQSTRLVSRAGHLIGMISTHWHDVHQPAERELRLFDVLARQATDLIERRRAEEALVESTARLRSAVALAGLGTCRWDWTTGELHGNEQRFLMCGLDPGTRVIREDLYGDMFHPEDRATVRPRILRHLEERGEYAEVYRVIRPDGNVRWFSQAGRVIDRQEDGRPWHVDSVLFDITTHREAEATIAESELRFRTLTNALPQVIWTNDPDGRANYFNQRWYEYTGLSSEQSNGPGWQTVAHPDDAPASTEKWRRALAAGEIFDAEYRLRRADGEYRWHLGRNVPLKDEAGRVVGWFGSATDIHDLKQAEQETERARVEVETAGVAKDHFLAVLSHELRTPLMPITMALAVLARRKDLPAAVTKTFAMIQRNVDLEARFIDDLLDVTRIERGKMEINPADMDLYQAVERAVEVSVPDFESKGQRLIALLENPPCPYHGDLARLQQVFWNLLKNASKFTPAGGSIEIRTRCRVGEQFVVEIIDTGIGLEADAIERIFRPFEQASTTITREFGGLGLGLAIAKATVDAHGGTIQVSSPGLGQGATFTVSLPLLPTAGGAAGGAI